MLFHFFLPWALICTMYIIHQEIFGVFIYITISCVYITMYIHWCCGILETWTVSDQLACMESVMFNICYS